MRIYRRSVKLPISSALILLLASHQETYAFINNCSPESSRSLIGRGSSSSWSFLPRRSSSSFSSLFSVKYRVEEEQRTRTDDPPPNHPFDNEAAAKQRELNFFYQVLGLCRKKCTQKTIKESYRRLARVYHPDANPTRETTERFQQINRAYAECLRDHLDNVVGKNEGGSNSTSQGAVDNGSMFDDFDFHLSDDDDFFQDDRFFDSASYLMKVSGCSKEDARMRIVTQANPSILAEVQQGLMKEDTSRSSNPGRGAPQQQPPRARAPPLRNPSPYDAHNMRVGKAIPSMESRMSSPRSSGQSQIHQHQRPYQVEQEFRNHQVKQERRQIYQNMPPNGRPTPPPQMPPPPPPPPRAGPKPPANRRRSNVLENLAFSSLNRNGPISVGGDLVFDVEIDFLTAMFGGEETLHVRHWETCKSCDGKAKIIKKKQQHENEKKQRQLELQQEQEQRLQQQRQQQQQLHRHHHHQLHQQHNPMATMGNMVVEAGPCRLCRGTGVATFQTHRPQRAGVGFQGFGQHTGECHVCHGSGIEQSRQHLPQQYQFHQQQFQNMRQQQPPPPHQQPQPYQYNTRHQQQHQQRQYQQPMAPKSGIHTEEKETSTCSHCHDKGIAGNIRAVKITIPPGAKDGSMIRVAGEGYAGPNGGASGDLYLTLRVTDFDGAYDADVFAEIMNKVRREEPEKIVVKEPSQSQIPVKFPVGGDVGYFRT